MKNNYEHIAKVVVEVAPLYKYTYTSLYAIIYSLIKTENIQPENINKEILIEYIEKYRKV